VLAKLILAFILVPIVEIYLLFKIAEFLGFWSTFGIVMITGALGGIAARHEGLKCLRDIKLDLMANINPSDRLWDGFLIFVGGLLLITPGILTDIAGFCLLLGPTRKPVKNYIKKKIKGKIDSGRFHFHIY